MKVWVVPAIIAAAVIILLMFFYVWSSSMAAPIKADCTLDEDCILSLCDCECYKSEEETPEAVQGIFCGRNCLAEEGVSGCECREDACKLI